MSQALLLNCREVTDRLTDYQEGALTPWVSFRVGLHLALCKGCQAFLTSLKTLPRLLGSPQGDGDLEIAKAVLARAKGKLGQARPARIPAALAAELAGGGDPLLRLQSLTHLAFVEGRITAQAPFLPPEVLEQVPPQNAWEWWTLGLRGARLAKLAASPDGGQELWILSMRGGQRFPTHRHLGQETLLILQGGLDDGLGIAEPGEWRHYPQGHPEHAPVSTAEGCWALIRLDAGSVRLAGWRGWLQSWLE